MSLSTTAIEPERAGLVLAAVGTSFMPAADYNVASELNKLPINAISNKKFTTVEIKSIFLLLQTLDLIKMVIRNNNAELNYWDLTNNILPSTIFLASITEKGILYLKNLTDESPLVAVVRS